MRWARRPAPPSGDAGLDPPYLLTLVAGETVSLPAGTSTAVVGTGAAELLGQLSGSASVALLLGDPADPLHSGLTVGAQIADALPGVRRAALDRATDLLEAAGVPEPHERVLARPHELTALDRQRAQLALALANQPELLLADDPVANLSPAAAAALAASLTRLQDKLGFTFLVAAPSPQSVLRLVREILILADGRVIERRRRQSATQSSSSPSA